MSQDNPNAANIKPQDPKSRKKTPRRISERYLHNAGLAYLQRFAASSAHFKTVMMRKIDRSCRHHTDQDPEACAGMLDALILKFQGLALLDDAAYLRGMVTSLRRRGLSTRLIESKLSQKGLDSTTVRSAVAAYDQENFSEDGEIHAATIFARKKRLGPFAKGDKPVVFEKALAAFARAGYSYDIARKIMESSKEDAEARPH